MKYGQMLVGALLTLVGIWIGMAFATETDATVEAKWWDLMTAFGTVFSAVGAVSIAVWQYWVIRRERYVEAVHVIGGAYPRFSTLTDALLSQKAFFENVLKVDSSPTVIKARLAILGREFSAADLPNPLQLIPLGGGHSRDLASVISHLQTVLHVADTYPMASREDRKKACEFVLTALRVAIPRLQSLAEVGHKLISEYAQS